MVLTLIERVVCVRLEEEVLQSHHDRVEVQHWLPVLAKDVQAHVALEVDIWMVDLCDSLRQYALGNMHANTYFLRALDLWWLVWVIVVDHKGEDKRAALVHA